LVLLPAEPINITNILCNYDRQNRSYARYRLQQILLSELEHLLRTLSVLNSQDCFIAIRYLTASRGTLFHKIIASEACEAGCGKLFIVAPR